MEEGWGVGHVTEHYNPPKLKKGKPTFNYEVTYDKEARNQELTVARYGFQRSGVTTFEAFMEAEVSS